MSLCLARRACVLLATSLLTAGPVTATWAGGPVTSLRVFAAASLAEPFADLARAFEASHPNTRVVLNLAGSQQLAAQLEQGAQADVFAAADEQAMLRLAAHSLLSGKPVWFAGNHLVVIVPRSNPGRVATLQDLARAGVKLIAGAEAVPVGRYTRQVLERLSREDACGPAYSRMVLNNIVSEEDNVTAVVGKVRLGEADAGFCYSSDVTAALARTVRVLPIPDSANVLARYPIAIVAASPRAAVARAFVALVLSADGRRTLTRHGLLAPEPGPP